MIAAVAAASAGAAPAGGRATPAGDGSSSRASQNAASAMATITQPHMSSEISEPRTPGASGSRQVPVPALESRGAPSLTGPGLAASWSGSVVW